MVRKIKPLPQAEWYCKRLEIRCTASLQALCSNGNWLCQCGRFIKDDIAYHKLIRQGEKIANEKSTIQHKSNKNLEPKEYIIIYWIGQYPNEKEMHTKVMATGDFDLIDKIENSHLKKCNVFRNGKQVYVK